MDYLARLYSPFSTAPTRLSLIPYSHTPTVSSPVNRAVLISITWPHRCDKSVCQQDIIIKLFQRSFNIAEEGLHFSPWKIRLKYNLCVRDELWNETFTEKMNCRAN